MYLLSIIINGDSSVSTPLVVAAETFLEDDILRIREYYQLEEWTTFKIEEVDFLYTREELTSQEEADSRTAAIESEYNS